jgi:hypothetical protein
MATERVALLEVAEAEGDVAEELQRLDVTLRGEVLEAAEARQGVWSVRIIRAGESLNRRVWPADVLRESAAVFEGRPLALYDIGEQLDHLPAGIRAHVGSLVRSTVGVLRGVRWDEATESLIGQAVITDGRLGQMLRDVAEATGGPVRAFGLSVAAAIEGAVRGAQQIVRRIREVRSVDVVTSPAAGGAFLEALESLGSGGLGGSRDRRVPMTREQILRRIRELQTQLRTCEAAESASITTEIDGLFAQLDQLDQPDATEAQQRPQTGPATQAPHPVPQHAEAGEARDELRTELEAVRAAREAAESLVAEQRTERLRAMVRGLVDEIGRAHTDRTRTELARSAALELEAGEAHDRETARGIVTRLVDAIPAPAGAHGARIVVGMGGRDKVQVGLHRLFGVAEEAEVGEAQVPAFRGIQQAYIQMSGDYDLLGPERGPLEAGEAVVTDASFPAALAETMHRRLVRAYRGVRGLETAMRLISGEPEQMNDFKTHRRDRIGGFADIPTVAAGAAYTEVTYSGGDEEPTYALVKKGRLLSIRWETIVNDDIGVITRLLDQHGASAARTLAKAIFALVAGNPTVWDTNSLYDAANHSNATTSAMSYASLIAARVAMLAQTEPGSSAPLGIDPLEGGLLIIPAALWQTAMELVRARGIPGSPNNDGSALWITDESRVITNPYATDADDWRVLADPSQWETIVLGFYRGQSEPTIIRAGAETAADMWTNDVISYKLRHIWSLVVSDYRTVYGGLVT